jgi:hypothetical protein
VEREEETEGGEEKRKSKRGDYLLTTHNDIRARKQKKEEGERENIDMYT